VLEIVEGEAVRSTGAPRLACSARGWSAWVGWAGETWELFSYGCRLFDRGVKCAL
jgi:hypothetical protein